MIKFYIGIRLNNPADSEVTPSFIRGFLSLLNIDNIKNSIIIKAKKIFDACLKKKDFVNTKPNEYIKRNTYIQTKFLYLINKRRYICNIFEICFIWCQQIKH
jgi:hypothetical protein